MDLVFAWVAVIGFFGLFISLQGNNDKLTIFTFLMMVFGVFGFFITISVMAQNYSLMYVPFVGIAAIVLIIYIRRH